MSLVSLHPHRVQRKLSTGGESCIFLFREMDVCLLFLTILLMNGNGLCQQEKVCPRSLINSCSDCIRSGPYCVWCKQLNFTRAGEQEAVRCDTQVQLLERGCSLDEIISPQNKINIMEKRPLSESLNNQELVQLSPQKISLKLRPGLSSTFQASFKRVQGYPVDLYYLMDLSNSMKDDLENVKGLGQDLFKALRNITAHAQIGFGAFVDKTVLPYTNTNAKKLQRPCDEEDQQCQAAFGYRHVLSMTPSAVEFGEKVKQQFISGNIDSPEGSLDAMMQAAVCGDQIGWRNRSTRLIVLTTDGGFHMAGDGKLAGILEPNDERCYMENNLYAKSSTMDYPSVGQLAMQLEKNNIQPIFAVTENVELVYKQLSEMIPKSEVGVLSIDSNNVVQLIEAAYKRLSSKVTLTHEKLPNHVKVDYTPRCPHPGPSRDVAGVCDNVKENEEIFFDVTVTADSCIQGKTFTISPLGIKDTLTVTLSTECECECNNPQDQTHPHCSGNGGVNCGICRCGEGSVGQFCECSVGDKDELTLRALCQRNNGTECEGRGECVCGRCKCFSIGGGKSYYYGDFCECDSQQCGRAYNKLCAGNGTCVCGRCECFPGFEGSACQCDISTEACLTSNNTVCHGRGNCRCSRCECIEGYKGPKCKECPGCPDPCQTKLNCIECLGFESGHFKSNCSAACSESVSHKMVDQFTLTSKKECLQKDSEGCWIKYKIEQLDGVNNYMAEILNERACPDPPNVTAIIGGSIASVALIGILLLMLIKLLIYMKDLKEFKRFENEKKKSKWAEADNPLFQNATTTVTNPTFTGE